MKHRVTRAVVGLVVLAFLVGKVQPAVAEILGTMDVVGAFSTPRLFGDQLIISLDFGPEVTATGTIPGAVLFELTLTTANIGETFTATAATDPDFVDAGSVLTNDVNDRIVLVIDRPGPGVIEQVHSEAKILFRDVVGINVVDFKGYTIERISLHINGLTIDSPGINLNNDGIWTDFSFDLTLTFEGVEAPIPAPGAPGSLTSDSGAMSQRIAALESEIDAITQQITGLTDQDVALFQKITTLEQTLDPQTTLQRITALESQIGMLSQQIVGLADRDTALQQQVTALQEALELHTSSRRSHHKLRKKSER